MHFVAATEYTGILDDTDLVVEAAVERVDLKKSIFKKLDAATKDECILATNTSSISITEIASGVESKDKVIGMHFFNPPCGHEADRGHPRRQHLRRYLQHHLRPGSGEIGKTPVTVAEAPGFVCNRLLIPMINEAIELVQNGVASPRGHRHRHASGLQPPHGPLTPGRLHRSGYLPGHHGYHL